MALPDPAALARELAEFQARAARALAALARDPMPALATSAREVVHAEGPSVLYRYVREGRARVRAPILIVFAMVNRPTVLDLEPDRSLIRRLLALGHDVFLLDWGAAGRGERTLGLDHYVLGVLHRAVLAVTEAAGKPDLLGICQGGTLSLLYASLEPTRLRRLVTMVTPVDFHTPDNLLSSWARGIDVGALAAAFGNVPGAWLNFTFQSLLPFRLTLQKYLALVDDADRPERLATFQRMERWVRDSPDQPGRAFAEFVRWFYQENRLVRGGLALDGRPVDLGRIRIPVLNVIAAADHIVPPSASRVLPSLVGGRCDELVFDTGHIGIYVSGRSQAVPAGISRWLVARGSGRTSAKG
jgi:polyhydroxyalkanoate synthase